MDQKLADFIHAAPWLTMGVRDARLRPHGVMVFGGRVDAATNRLSVFLSAALSGTVTECLKATGKAAVTIGEPVHHETYQFKGDVVEVRPMTPDEEAVQDIFFSKMFAAMKSMGLPVEAWGMPPVRPGLTAVIQVTDIFAQTPGPGAGGRIGP